MADFIKISPPPTQSTISGLVIPDSDGTFVATVTAYAEGNNQGTPTIWGAINVNDRTAGETDPAAWQDGPQQIEVLGPFEAVKGKTYRIEAMSGNKNARATGIKMTIERTPN